MKTLFKNGTVVTMNPQRETFIGDILVNDDKILKIAPDIVEKDCLVISCENQFVIPGLIQAHTHLCQTLFRGYADDLKLLDWLQTKIWPMESLHTRKSIQASAEISLLEMQLLGTTSILDMATIKHTSDMLEVVEKSNMRYWGGKCFMDLKDDSGPLFESMENSVKETEELISKWHNKTDLIQYALCPRFAISCSEEMLKWCVEKQKESDLIVHIHASESAEEVDLIKQRTGFSNLDYLDHLGMLNKNLVVIHGVHLTDSEVKRMVKENAGLVHCPSSNLKLASGIAPLQDYETQGLKMGVGADGAPCNNTMDPFLEMRLSALLQKPKFGPEAFPAEKALELATIGGAKVLNADHRIGSLEVGKQADIVTVDRSHPSVQTVENPYSSLVYSCSGRDVNHVMINGQLIVKDKVHQIFDKEVTVEKAKKELQSILHQIH